MAVIRFGMADPPAPLLDQIRRLGGVREVSRAGGQITVRGHRRIIAYVGAVLVRWESVPADLSVQVPSLEVLTFIGRGKTNGEIAAELFVSEGTVKTHINHLFTKLRLRDRAAAVVFAFDHGLVKRPG